METLKNENRKMNGKEQGEGATAGMNTENKSQHNDALEAAIARAAEKAAETLAKAAREPISVMLEMRDNGATFYVLGSEIACLRLAYQSINTKGRPEIRFVAPLNKWCCIMQVEADEVELEQEKK